MHIRYFIFLLVSLLTLIGIVGATTVTLYPDMDYIMLRETPANYTAQRNSATSEYLADNGLQPYLRAYTTTNNYDRFGRGILVFNTNNSVLPVNATINSAKLGLYIGSVKRELNTPSLVLTGGTLASNSTVVYGDFDGFTNVEYADRIPYSDISLWQYTNLSITNLSLIQMGASGTTVVFLRDSMDVDNSSPTWVSGNISWLERETLVNTYKPFLEIDYAVIGGSDPWFGYIPPNINGDAPLTITFTDISHNNPTSWNWWFRNVTGDNASHMFSIAKNSSYTFNTGGNYSVWLNASNSYGYNITPDLVFVNITGSSIANFIATPTSGASPLTVYFTDTSSNSPTAWKWYWSANETVSSTIQNPIMTFPTGVYNVRLNASNSAGFDWENKTAYITVTSGGAPVANFTANRTLININDAVLFTDTSTNSPTAWYWVISDDLFYFTTRNVTHIFINAGSFTVTLNASNSAGFDWESKPNMITVIPYSIPVSAFSANTTSGITPLSVKFTDATTNLPINWDWYWFNNETKSSDLESPSAIFTTGVYNVRLWTWNTAGGDWENKTAYITVTSGAVTPVSSFTEDIASGYAPLTVHFTDTSTNTPTTWYWNWGDGGWSYIKNPIHTYTVPSTYLVTLEACNSAGCNTSAGHTITILPPPTTSPTPTPTPVIPTTIPTTVPPGTGGSGWSPHMRDMAVTTMATIPAQRLDNITEALFGGWNETNQSPDWEPIITNSIAVYTDFLGPVAFLLIFLIPFGMMWLAHGNMKLLSILGIIVGLFIFAYLPANFVAAAIICIVVAGVTLVWSLFKQ